MCSERVGAVTAALAARLEWATVVRVLADGGVALAEPRESVVRI